jgi:hypothetical protein
MTDTPQPAAPAIAPAPSAPTAAPSDAEWAGMSFAERTDHARSAGPAQSNPSGAPAGGQQQSPQQQPGRRPHYVPEQFFDPASGKVDEDKFGEYVNTLTAKEAAEKSRRALIPEPTAYKSELPADFKFPAGLNFEINENDPIYTQYRTMAFEAGLDQGTFSKGLGMIAALRVGEAQHFQMAFNAEVAKLGATASDRVTAVTTWLGAMGGKDADALVKVMTMCPRADTIIAFENLMRKVSSQGGGGYSSSHRDAPTAGPSDAEWAAMSYSQKREFTQTHNK